MTNEFIQKLQEIEEKLNHVSNQMQELQWKQLEGHPTKTRSCVENFTSIRGTNISGNSLSLVEIIQSPSKKKQSLLSKQDMEFQEQRKKRKVKRLDFDER